MTDVNGDASASCGPGAGREHDPITPNPQLLHSRRRGRPDPTKSTVARQRCERPPRAAARLNRQGSGLRFWQKEAIEFPLGVREERRTWMLCREVDAHVQVPAANRRPAQTLLDVGSRLISQATRIFTWKES
jgi:hypothetical protein